MRGKSIARFQRAQQSRGGLKNFARLSAGSTTTRDVRALLGPPNRAFRNERQQREVWEYLYYNAAQIPFILYVQASDDGVVREVVTIGVPDSALRLRMPQTAVVTVTIAPRKP